MNDKTGGPAFPVDRYWEQYNTGMTMRDYFAAQAMQGLIARQSSGAFNFETCKDDPWRVALWAYDVADQMIKVRTE